MAPAAADAATGGGDGMYVLTSAEMQTLDRLTIEQFGLPGRLLMENAGREAARVFLSRFADIARQGVGAFLRRHRRDSEHAPYGLGRHDTL